MVDTVHVTPVGALLSHPLAFVTIFHTWLGTICSFQHAPRFPTTMVPAVLIGVFSSMVFSGDSCDEEEMISGSIGLNSSCRLDFTLTPEHPRFVSNMIDGFCVCNFDLMR